MSAKVADGRRSQLTRTLSAGEMMKEWQKQVLVLLKERKFRKVLVLVREHDLTQEHFEVAYKQIGGVNLRKMLVTEVDKPWNTSIAHSIFSHGQLSAVEWLIKHVPEVCDARTKLMKQTPLHELAQRSKLECDGAKMARLFTSVIESSLTHKDCQGYIPLHYLGLYGHQDAYDAVVNRAPMLANAIGNDAQTPATLNSLRLQDELVRMREENRRLKLETDAVIDGEQQMVEEMELCVRQRDEKIKNYEERIARLQQDYDDMATQHKRLKTQLEQYELQLSEANVKCESAVQESRAARDNLLQTEKQLEKARNESETVQQQLALLETRMATNNVDSTNIAKDCERLADELEILKQERARTQALLAESQKEISEADAVGLRAVDTNKALRNELSEMEEEIERIDALRAAAQEKYSRVETEKEHLEQQMHEQSQQATQALARCQQLEKQSANESAHVKRLQQELDNARNHSQQVENEIEKLREQRDEMDKRACEVDTERLQKIDVLYREKLALEDKLQQLKRAQIEQELATKEKLGDAMRKMENLRSAAQESAVHSAKLKQQLEDTRIDAHKQLSEMKLDMEQNIKQMQTLENVADEHERQREMLEAISKRESELQQTLDDKQKKLDEASQISQEMQNQLDETAKHVENLQNVIEQCAQRERELLANAKRQKEKSREKIQDLSKKRDEQRKLLKITKRQLVSERKQNSEDVQLTRSKSVGVSPLVGMNGFQTCKDFELDVDTIRKLSKEHEEKKRRRHSVNISGLETVDVDSALAEVDAIVGKNVYNNDNEKQSSNSNNNNNNNIRRAADSPIQTNSRRRRSAPGAMSLVQPDHAKVLTQIFESISNQSNSAFSKIDLENCRLNSPFMTNVFLELRRGNWQLMETLLGIGFHPNTKSGDNKSMLEVVLRAGEEVHNSALLGSKQRAQMIDGLTKVLQLLIERGADWKDLDKYVADNRGSKSRIPEKFSSILSTRDENSPFCRALLDGDQEGAIAVLESVENFDRIPKKFAKKGYSYLHIAVDNEYTKLIHALVATGRVNVNIKDANFRTPLQMLLQKCNDKAKRASIAECLMAGGARAHEPCIYDKLINQCKQRCHNAGVDLSTEIYSVQTTTRRSSVCLSNGGDKHLALSPPRHVLTSGGGGVANGTKEKKGLARMMSRRASFTVTPVNLRDGLAKLNKESETYGTPLALARSFADDEQLLAIVSKRKYSLPTTNELEARLHKKHLIQDYIVRCVQMQVLIDNLIRDKVLVETHALYSLYRRYRYVFNAFNPRFDYKTIVTESILDAAGIDVHRYTDAKYSRIAQAKLEQMLENDAATIDDCMRDSINDTLLGLRDTSESFSESQSQQSVLKHFGTKTRSNVCNSARDVIDNGKTRFASNFMKVVCLCEHLLQCINALHEQWFDVSDLILTQVHKMYDAAVVCAVRKFVIIDCDEELQYMYNRVDLFGLLDHNAVVDQQHLFTAAELAAHAGSCRVLQFLLREHQELATSENSRGRTIASIGSAAGQPCVAATVDHFVYQVTHETVEELSTNESRSDELVRINAPNSVQHANFATPQAAPLHVQHYCEISFTDNECVLHQFVAKRMPQQLAFVLPHVGSKLIDSVNLDEQTPLDYARLFYHNTITETMSDQTRQLSRECMTLLSNYTDDSLSSESLTTETAEVVQIQTPTNINTGAVKHKRATKTKTRHKRK